MIKITMKGNLRKELDGAVKVKTAVVMRDAVKALREATPVDTGEARDGWRIVGTSIVNDVDHIERLNAGSSNQAPSHFIEKTLLAQPGISPSGTIVRSL